MNLKTIAGILKAFQKGKGHGALTEKSMHDGKPN